MLLKFVLLFCVNCSLIVFLHRRRALSRQDLFENNNKQTSVIQVKSRSRPNALLLASSVLYFTTTFPLFIVTILNIMASPPYCSYVFPGYSGQIVLTIVNLGTMCNYSLKIVVYCLVSRRFRLPFLSCYSKVSYSLSSSFRSDSTSKS